ncbi:alpha-N-acetylglucosaminidase TIM-barrel domain-containing protein [Aeromicrobium ginsengisoli]|uniref:Alpha-N-acetylglucosaminidase n=1 Tax=Aeromicrobium ginsengisoli TaxID=363867 RepID=A0A5M4FEA1_9ACTN|nr:alpha-N-acetylglucosaminidase TIM-barrel domain-containing protein [Aeromicrobium ginsengisoli]KAA1397667.1 alpha-N-acetylglucosaminidase [Aeromicrobium ginsengisoli]
MPTSPETDGAPAPAPWVTEVEALWARVTGGTCGLDVEVLTARTDRSYEAQSRSDRLTVRATDAGAACVAIHQFLRRHCGVAVMWDTALPLRISELGVSDVVAGSAIVPDLYYLNFCTFGYSTAFWGWPEWEREIDWMALHGVTMPLALVGHEATLRLAYGRLGMPEDDVRRFLGGPAYLPWVYMGNLDSFAGPLPEDWIDEHLELGQRVIDRQRALGMTPVLPAFTGHIPREIAPDGAKTRLWQGHETTVVAPEDPLFVRVTSEVVAAQQELFGTDHLYASDPFIEMVPEDTDASADYPAAVAAAVVQGLADADPEAVWVLQSWPFAYQGDYWTAERVHTFLDAIPADRLLVLDLWAEARPQWERLEGFFGRRWLWNGLLNFGGRSEPVADLRSAVDGFSSALESNHPPVGVGLTMEAIHNNPVFFELVADRAWSAEPLDHGIRRYARERYGVESPRLVEAWADLAATIFDGRGERIFPEFFISIVVAKPAFESLLRPDATIHDDIRSALYFDPQILLRAWRTLADVARERPDLVDGPLGADLAQVGTAALVRIIDARLSRLLGEAVASGRTDPGTVASFLSAFDDLELLVATRPESRYDSWEQAALRWGSEPETAAVLRDNARRILTVWNSADDEHLDGYAARLWSGLVTYYQRRWARWCELLPEALENPADAEAVLAEDLRVLAETFIAEGPAPVEAGSVLDESTRLLQAYGDELAGLAGGGGRRG